MATEIKYEEVRESFLTFPQALAFFEIQMESIRGYRLRNADLSFDREFDTQIERWHVYIRWVPIPATLIVIDEP